MKVTGNSDQNRIEHRSHVHSFHSPKGAEAGKDGAQAAAAGVSGESGTRPEISARGRELANVKEAAGKAPDVREEKIAKLKALIAADQYKINPHAIADRLVDEHLSSGIG